MSYIENFIVDAILSGKRIDCFLKEVCPNYSRSYLQSIIVKGNVTVNGLVVNKHYRLTPEDRIEVKFPQTQKLEVLPEDIPLDIVYEDQDLIVVNKQKGLVVHPAPGHYTGTLVNALLYYCRNSLSEINGVLRPGIVHRIDKDTSGLLIVAKNDFAHNFLAQQIQEHSFIRQYHAIVYGKLHKQEGIVNQPIGRSQRDRKKMCVTQQNSKQAITHYKVLEEFKDFSYISLRLETGRTHQIRVHMSFLGHPVAGDPVYGPKRCIESLHGQCLHAKTIGFIHPTTKQKLYFESGLPDYFTNFLNRVSRHV